MGTLEGAERHVVTTHGGAERHAEILEGNGDKRDWLGDVKGEGES